MYSPNMYNVFNVVFEVVGGGSQPAGQDHKKLELSRKQLLVKSGKLAWA